MSGEIHATPVVIDAQNPWPGLSAFDEGARRFFNGRDAESAELARLVSQAPLTVLFGKSGLGKTSLLQAGLFPRLRQHFLPVYIRFDVRDRSAPLIQQAATMLKAEIKKHCSADVAVPSTDKSLWEYLHGYNIQWWSTRNQPLTPLFVFDQFEETFTFGTENADAIEQLRLDLADLIENRIPLDLAHRIEEGAHATHLDLRGQHYKALLSFREDFLPEVEGWKVELPSIMRNRLRLLPMNADCALQVVSGSTPAGRTHELVSDETAREIVNFVAAVQTEDQKTGPNQKIGKATELPWDRLEIEPVLLSLVCEGLNEKRKSNNQATIEADLLRETGKTIISDFYQRSLADVPGTTRHFIENFLISEGGYRNSYPLQDALNQGLLTDSLLRQLVDCRMLRVEHQLGAERVELIHDRLTDVVREARDKERIRKRELEEQEKRLIEERRKRELEEQKERKRRLQLRAAVISVSVAFVLAVVFLQLWIKTDEARIQAVRSFNLYKQEEEKRKKEEKLRISTESELHQKTDILERGKELKIADEDREHALSLVISGRNVIALDLLSKSLLVYKKHNENKKTAITYVDIGKIYAFRKQFDIAKINYDEALIVARRMKNETIEGLVLESLASLFEQKGNLPEAMKLYHQAILKYSAKGEEKAGARIMERFAAYAEERQDYKVAGEWYRKALKKYEIDADAHGVARAKGALTRIVPWGFLINLRTAKLYEMRGDRVTIGGNWSLAGVRNDVGFPRREISRQHLVINREGFQAEDLRSLNGTTVNGVQLEYGRGLKLSDGDMISLANMEVLQFKTAKSLPSAPPPSTWGIFINGEKKGYQYLTGSEYSVVMKDGKLSLEQGVSEVAALKLRYVDRKAQLYEVKDEWSLVFTMKESDYDYGKRVLPSGEWVELPNLPSTYMRLSPDRQEILSEGPSFQIVTIDLPPEN